MWLFLSLSILLSPQVEVKALKLKTGDSVNYSGAFLKAEDFILLKNHIESGKPEAALKACVASCNEQVELILSECVISPPDDSLIIEALQYELLETKTELKKTTSQAKAYFYFGLGGGVLGALAILWMYTA